MFATCVLWKPEEVLRFPGAGVTGCREWPDKGAGNGAWVLEEQQIALTTEPSLNPLVIIFFKQPIIANRLCAE